MRVANNLPHVGSRLSRFRIGTGTKDACDLVDTLLHPEGGPRAAGAAARASPLGDDDQVGEALMLLGERFPDIGQDGPRGYATFLAERHDSDGAVRRCQEAVATVRAFFAGLGQQGQDQGAGATP